MGQDPRRARTNPPPSAPPARRTGCGPPPAPLRFRRPPCGPLGNVVRGGGGIGNCIFCGLWRWNFTPSSVETSRVRQHLTLFCSCRAVSPAAASRSPADSQPEISGQGLLVATDRSHEQQPMFLFGDFSWQWEVEGLECWSQ